MTTRDDLSILHSVLLTRPMFGALQPDDLERLPDKGLAHDHIRIKTLRIDGHRPLIRVPLLSQFALDPETNLAYQTACFERASQSGHIPRLIDRIEPSTELPMGALVVDEIEGCAVSLPRDLNGMAECFAHVHCLDVPAPTDRPPLAYHADPVAGIMAFIEAQAPFIPDSARNPDVLRLLDEEMAWARSFAAEKAGLHPPARLCLTDTHPGNFMVRSDGSVCFTDLEKALYGSPAVDLGHATILTSTLWDTEVQAELSRSEIRAFYAAYLDALPRAMADNLRPWLLPMRRLAWLRSTTWSCKWYAERYRNQPVQTGLRAQVQAHVGRRLAAFVDLETVLVVRTEWHGPDSLTLD